MEENELVHDPTFRILDGLALVALLAVLTLAGCGDDSHPVNGGPPQPVDPETLDRMAVELDGRSFRRFQPSRDGNPRSGVILDFTDGFSLWAQQAKDGRAVHEWEITAANFRIESTAEPSEFVLFPETVKSERQFPDPCLDCIPTAGISVSVRDVLDEERIVFRINDPDRVLPSPFPLFGAWTRFNEDEVFH